MHSPSQTQKQQRIENLLSDGLSVETIAMMTGTSVRYVNHFVNSKNNPPLETLHNPRSRTDLAHDSEQ
jgi:transcriptional regulator with XRE-family HTH domain